MLWQVSEKLPVLKKNQIHVWRVELKRKKEELADFSKLLNLEERVRAARFIAKDARNSFIAARGILRTLIAGYLNLSASEIVFQQNQYGKLYLASSVLRFNLAHSKDLVLFVFALDSEVGVDVEFIRRDLDFADIAERFFSKDETQDLFSLPEDKQLLSFFNCWTRKEAFIKAKGLGVYHGLDNFSVEVSSKKEGPVALDQSSWSLEAVDPQDRYVGAFAVNLREYSSYFYDFCL